MKTMFAASMMAVMIGSAALSGTAMAQPRPDERQEQGPGKPNPKAEARHDDRHSPPKSWHKHTKSSYKKGGHVSYNDWQRGKAVDYRQHKKLKAPPRGYEWRQIDNRYVLAAVATGVIATIILTR